MDALRIKNSDLEFSRLGLGTGTGFNKDCGKTKKQLFHIFDAALENGINWLDTAESYANGFAEQLIGDYIRSRKNKISLATKFSPVNAGSKSLRSACEKSLKRLGVETIELYQVHWMNYRVPLEETLSTLNALRNEGKIRAIGVCNFDERALLLCNKYSSYIATNQIEFNLFNRAAENRLFGVHDDLSITSIAYSPLDGVRSLLRHSEKYKAIDKLALKYEVSHCQIALSFLARYPNLVIAYSSTSEAHIKENCRLVALSESEIEELVYCFSSSMKYVDPKLIRIMESLDPVVYGTVEAAKKNVSNFYPGVTELAEEFATVGSCKPIKVRALRGVDGYKYELIGGMMRYWGWVLAFGKERPISVVVIGE